MCVLDSSIKQLSRYLEVDDMLNSVGVAPFWIKDINFRFLRYNQAMIDLLYPGAQKDELIGLTDWEYIEKLGRSKEEVERTRDCCTYSDVIVLESDKPSQKFFEFVKATNGVEMWFLTTKVRIPPEAKKEEAQGIYGTAIIFPWAPKIIETEIIKTKQLSKDCYLLIE